MSLFPVIETRREPDALSFRQRQCLTLAGQGWTSSRIGRALGLSSRTVDDHLFRACRLLGVKTRIQAVARLIHAGQDLPFTTDHPSAPDLGEADRA